MAGNRAGVIALRVFLIALVAFVTAGICIISPKEGHPMNTETLIQAIGYFSTVLILISFLMTSVVKLRLLNLAGSIVFVIFAFLTKSYPTAIMNIGLCIINIYFANKTYLKLYLQYENAYACYSAVITQVKQTEGFDESCKLAVLGKGSNLLYIPVELDTGDLAGPDGDLVNVYTRERLIKRYLGFDMPFASDEEKAKLLADPRYEAMPAYPYYGSVQKIDDFIVVKLG